jgi:hypothetical protein
MINVILNFPIQNMKSYKFLLEEFDEWVSKNPILVRGNMRNHVYDDIFIYGDYTSGKDVVKFIEENRIDSTNTTINIQKVHPEHKKIYNKLGYAGGEEGPFNIKYEVYVYGEVLMLHQCPIRTLSKDNRYTICTHHPNPSNMWHGDFSSGCIFKETSPDGTISFGFEFDKD